MNILFVQHHGFINGSGGTEKICTFLANGLAAQGHRVQIATNQSIEGKPFFPLSFDVTVENIFNTVIGQQLPQPLINYRGNNLWLWIKFKVRKKLAKYRNSVLFKKHNGETALYQHNLRQRSKAWKAFIQKTAPDLIITMSIGSLLEITFENTYNIPIINSTNGRPDYDYTDVLWYRSNIEMTLLKESFTHLLATQVLFESYKSFLPETFAGTCSVIANPVPQFADKEIVNHMQSKERYKIVQLASLVTDCKQQHIAIDVFSKIANKYPNWDLYFWGTGNDESLLSNRIKAAKLSNRIFLMGLTHHPLKVLSDADVFIFPSRYEGFPLALTEAMSAGLPCIGLTTCSGVNELIKHNENGFLATTRNEMQQQLEQLIRSPETRSRLGSAAHLSTKIYAPEKIQTQWLKLIEGLA